ncbi:MAG: hypothetical protein IPM76_20530 [Chloroflexi bacterium]|nr:hypothetical protein [Chloroflexota bacterium]
MNGSWASGFTCGTPSGQITVRFLDDRASLAAAVLALCALFIFGLHYFSPISYNGSDARYSLYVTQELARTGSLRLDSLEDAWGTAVRQDYRLRQIDGHVYYYFPIGSSLFSLPFVWGANRLGIFVDSPLQEDALQNFIAACVSALIFLAVYGVFRSALGRQLSLLAALATMLGSAFSSSLGTGLWTLNFAALFVLAALWLLLRADSGQSPTVHPVWLGGLLFAAYLTRPTTAVFIVLTFVYLLWRKRREAGLTAVTAVGLLLLFVIYTRTTMGLWLPPYYLPQRLAGSGVPVPIVLYGLLFSPGRGLFTFSPMFLLVLLLAAWKWRALRQEPFYGLALAWIGLHTATLLRFEHWWGGHSFGPRLLTDIVPAFMLLTIVFARQWPAGLRPSRQRWLMGLGVVSVMFSVYVNSYAGLYQVATAVWNITPDIDRAPQYLFNWRYPQFTATTATNCAKVTEFHRQRLASGAAALAPYQPGAAITWQDARPNESLKRDPQWYLPAAQRRTDSSTPVFEDPQKLFLPLVMNGAPSQVLFVGWEEPGETAVHTACQSAMLAFRFTDLVQAGPYTMHLTVQSTNEQAIMVQLNGAPLGSIYPSPEFQNLAFSLDSQQFHADGFDLIEFTTPDGSPLNLFFQTLTLSD